MTRTTRPPRSAAMIEDPTNETIERESDTTDTDALGDIAALGELDSGMTWYLYRQPTDGTPSGAWGRYLTRGNGPFDLEAIRRLFGGGRFRVMVRRGKEFVQGLTFEVEGAPIMPQQPAAAPSTPDPPAGVLEAIRAMGDRLDRLQQHVERAPATRETDPFELALRLAERMRPQGETAGFETLSRVFQQGIELGLRSEGGDSWASVAREIGPKLLELGERFLGAARPGGTGTIVPAGSTPAPAAPGAAPRGAPDLVLMLVRALRKGADSAELADVAETLLSDVELAQLRSAPPDQLTVFLRQFAGTFPELGAENLGEFVAAFVEALRNPPAADA